MVHQQNSASRSFIIEKKKLELIDAILSATSERKIKIASFRHFRPQPLRINNREKSSAVLFTNTKLRQFLSLVLFVKLQPSSLLGKLTIISIVKSG